MKKFNFSLNAVRTIRQRQEQFALEQFGHAVQNRQQAADVQEAAERKLQTGWQQLETLQMQGGTNQEMRQLQRYCDLLNEEVAAAREKVRVAQLAANNAWEALIEARHQLEVVEKFFQRRRDDYERELRDEEQKQLDELAGQRRPLSLFWNPPANNLN